LTTYTSCLSGYIAGSQGVTPVRKCVGSISLRGYVYQDQAPATIGFWFEVNSLVNNAATSVLTITATGANHGFRVNLNGVIFPELTRAYVSPNGTGTWGLLSTFLSFTEISQWQV
jgi:hypothetical protein